MADFICLVDTALASIPVNIFPLTDDTDFKSEENPAYNAAGMDLIWVFTTVGGTTTQTAVTPTTGGDYDWSCSNGMATIEMPASGGASVNNDTEGFGYFIGRCTGVMPWRGPVIQFSPANIVNSFVVGSDYLQTDIIQIGGTAYASVLATEASISSQIQTDMQSDPTDFPVNVMEIEGVDATDAIQAGAQAAIEANHLDHLLAADYDPASKPGVATALLNELVENDSGVSRFTENALEQAPSGTGGDASAANQTTIIGHLTDIKGGTWSDETLVTIQSKAEDVEVDTQDLQTQIGTDGAGLTAIPWNASWDAEVQSECADAITAAGVSTHTAADVVTAIWAKVIDTTRTFSGLMKDLMAFVVGNSETSISGSTVTQTFYAEDGVTTQMEASITSTGRTITDEAEE